MTGDLLLFMAGTGAIIVYVLFKKLVRRRIAHKARLTDLGTPVCPICDHRSRLMSAPCSHCGFDSTAPPTPQESALQELAIAIACYEAAGTEFQMVLNAAANHGMDQIVDRPKRYLEGMEQIREASEILERLSLPVPTAWGSIPGAAAALAVPLSLDDLAEPGGGFFTEMTGQVHVQSKATQALAEVRRAHALVSLLHLEHLKAYIDRPGRPSP